MIGKLFNEEQENHIVKIYEEQRIAAWKIGEMFGCSERPILSILHRKNIKLKNTFDYMAHPFTEVERNFIIESYIGGKSQNFLANFFDVSRKVIKNVLTNKGIKTRTISDIRKLPVEVHAEIIKMYQNNISIKRIAEKFGVNHTAICFLLKQFRIPKRLSLFYPEGTEDKVIADYIKGDTTIVRLAERYNITSSIVSRILKNNKIEITRFPDSDNSSKISGISGRYKNIPFRSLGELSFIVNYLEVKFNGRWEKGENMKHVIRYFDKNGRLRKYFPDFIVNNKFIFECKPKKFWKDETVQLKKKFAIQSLTGGIVKYVMVDFPIKPQIILEAYKRGDVTFSDFNRKRFTKFLKID